MISSVFINIFGLITLLLIMTNTVLVATPMYVITVFKLLLPVKRWQKLCAYTLDQLASVWVWGIARILEMARGAKWDITGLEDLSIKKWYFVNSNHQSWADIFIILRIFNYRIPFIKFFIKQELIWVPVAGLIWWALDYPFMKRYSKVKLKKNPHLVGKDLERTKLACQKFKDFPVTILNFLEGTRFSKEKQNKQKSPYNNLLKPKAGGFAYALNAMDGKIDQLIDVTIVFPSDNITFWNFVCGKYGDLKVSIKLIDIPKEFVEGTENAGRQQRLNFQNWVKELWMEKDQLINTLKESSSKNLNKSY
ncbi:MAG: acyltransferase [Proteobacteria bacterium]|nr:acyltransferase [Pseudomonadota bacterium]